jgi:hypothetical protein
VQVVLDRNDILPKAMYLFLPNWKAEAKHREVYEFAGREVNSTLDKIKETVFNKAFIDTKVGSDWTIIPEPWVPEQQPQPGQPTQLQQPSPHQQPSQQPAGPTGAASVPGRVAVPPGQPPKR